MVLFEIKSHTVLVFFCNDLTDGHVIELICCAKLIRSLKQTVLQQYIYCMCCAVHAVNESVTGGVTFI